MNYYMQSFSDICYLNERRLGLKGSWLIRDYLQLIPVIHDRLSQDYNSMLNN